jgi:hexosaminidase
MAEVLWTPAEKKNFDDFLRRMRVHRRRLVGMGVNCAPLE